MGIWHQKFNMTQAKKFCKIAKRGRLVDKVYCVITPFMECHFTSFILATSRPHVKASFQKFDRKFYSFLYHVLQGGPG